MTSLNRYTLITGGSEGIGFEFAKIYAKNKDNLIIIAKDEIKLRNAKSRLEEDYGVIVEIIQCDLSVDKGYKKIIEVVEEKNLIVDNLINNAGIGCFGFFHDLEEGLEEKIININITALTMLTKYFSKKMVERRHGGILNVASTAAFIGGPKMSIYYSSKAYVLSLTEAIHDELKDLGIRVSCLCPGPVRTSFQEKAGIKKSQRSKRYLMNASDIAKCAYREFSMGKTIIIPGYKNKLLILGNKLIPRALGRRIILKNNS